MYAYIYTYTSLSIIAGSARLTSCHLGEHKPGRIKPGRIERAALSLPNRNYYVCCCLIRPRLYAAYINYDPAYINYDPAYIVYDPAYIVYDTAYINYDPAYMPLILVIPAPGPQPLSARQ